MSKSVGNIVDPWDVFDGVGADPLRWYLAARIAPGAQKRVSIDLVREVAQTFLNTWWNTYAFFVLYARLDKSDVTADVPVTRRPEIDRWILALLQRTIETVTACLDAYDAQGAGQAIEAFVDQLSNWYVRRNRRRFWKAAAGEDKQSAYLTLYECLDATNRMMAPFMPFTAEAVYSNLVRTVDPEAAASVHVGEWPEADAAKKNEALIADFDAAQQVVALGRAARNASRVRVPPAPAPPPGASAQSGGGGCDHPARSPHPRRAEHQAARVGGAGRRPGAVPNPAKPAAGWAGAFDRSSPPSAGRSRRHRTRCAGR